MAQRVMLCRSFASVLHLLHTNDLVVGDLNGRNAVFGLFVLRCLGPATRLLSRGTVC